MRLPLARHALYGNVYIVMNKSATVSIRLTAEERNDLNDLSRCKGTPPTTLGAQFISEGLRMTRFPGIEFRNTTLGRLAYVKRSRVAVWQLRELIRQAGSVKRVSDLLGKSEVQLQGAMLYARAFPEELEAAARLNRRDASELDAVLPHHSVLRV